MKNYPKILLIYTGGTIGMVENKTSKVLEPLDFKNFINFIPEISKLKIQISSITFKKPIDSSNINPKIWVKLAKIIDENYKKYDGFVILHGTDTMAYTASALSFMIQKTSKPIILTGSQLPIGIIRTDGKENLITSIEIAASKSKNKTAIVPEIAIYFEYKLFRGNRSTKLKADEFDAFHSPNYPKLAEAGVNIKYNKQAVLQQKKIENLNINYNFNDKILIIFLFPGLQKNIFEYLLNNPNINGVILKTYGFGNCISKEWFFNAIKKAMDRGVIFYNVSQCIFGAVNQDVYASSYKLKKLGTISGKDITIEAATTKMMLLLGSDLSKKKIKEKLSENTCGELTI